MPAKTNDTRFSSRSTFFSITITITISISISISLLSIVGERGQEKRRDETRLVGGWGSSQPKPSSCRHQGRSDAGPTCHLWGPTAFSSRNAGTSRSWTVSFLRSGEEGICGDAFAWIWGPRLREGAERATTTSRSFHHADPRRFAAGVVEQKAVVPSRGRTHDDSLQVSSNRRPLFHHADPRRFAAGVVEQKAPSSTTASCHIHQLSVRGRVAYDEGILGSLRPEKGRGRRSPQSHLIYPLRFLREEPVFCCRTDLGFGWPRIDLGDFGEIFFLAPFAAEQICAGSE
ncbi:hypothetical protein B296_00007005 [Ensete ventricosum]|uniref:Uncharacterized protein n=1 Tax=Ensete ventricosum TaxID=4639 RepID=A0A427ALP4_ENSVE|nr:hypothetical protein B296_00007005 [Ensete ventricosum]